MILILHDFGFKWTQAEDGETGAIRKQFVTFVLGNKQYNKLLIFVIINDLLFDDPNWWSCCIC